LRAAEQRATLNKMKVAAALRKSLPRKSERRISYEQDFHAWVLSQVNLLREHRFSELDLENLIEEVEDLARSVGRELRSRLLVLLVHLLKWRYQPSRKSTSWDLTLFHQRNQILQLLEESPSVKRTLPDVILKTYPIAQKEAGKEMRLDKSQWARTFPAQCPWTIEQILDEDYLPNGTRTRG
jgi:hypothetical protein